MSRNRRLQLHELESRLTPTGFLAVAADAGGGPVVQLLDTVTHQERSRFFAYEPSFTGGVYLAVGDLTGDQVPDIVTGAGVGGGPLVRVFDGVSLAPVTEFYAYETTFRGGVSVSLGNLDGDPELEILTGTGFGGGPVVTAFDWTPRGVREMTRFLAYESTFRGGVHVAIGNVDGIATDEIVTGAGIGGAPLVRVFTSQGEVITNDFAYHPSVRTGVAVAVGDLDLDGRAEVVTGAGAGGGPHVRIFPGDKSQAPRDFLAYSDTVRSGVRVSIGDLNEDGRLDVITAPGRGVGPHVRAFDGTSLNEVYSAFAIDSGFLGGVQVAARATPFTGSATGVFTSVTPTTAAYTLSGSHVSYGIPYNGPGGGLSELHFTGGSFGVNVGDSFALGTLAFTNRVNELEGLPDRVNLRVTVTLDGLAGARVERSVDVPIYLTITTNSDDADASSDSITLSTALATQFFTLPDGSSRALRILGFGAPGGGFEPVRSLTVREEETGTVTLVGELSPPILSQVQLGVSNTTPELLDPLTFQVSSGSTTLAAATYEVRLKRPGEADWTTVATGTGTRFSYVPRLAGRLEAQGVIHYKGQEFLSPIVPIEVQFPDFLSVATDGSVLARARAAFQSTEQFTVRNPAFRREEAFWVILDTSSGMYTGSPSSNILGTAARFFETPTLTPGTPPVDVIVSPNLATGSARYLVAAVHTHTPTTYTSLFSRSRPVGPSPEDQTLSTTLQLPGLVYDYVAPSTSPGVIPDNHPIGSASQFYWAGPERRPSP